MGPRDIENFYNNYKNSISLINRIENRLLKESYSYEKWYECLLEKSKLLRDIYARNLDDYRQIIAYIIDHADELDDATHSEILTHIDFFITEGLRDYGVTVPVLNAVLPYWEKKGIPGKIMDCNFFLGISLANARFYGEATHAYTRALNCFEKPGDCPEPYWEYRMMCTAYFRLLAYVELGRYSQDLLYEYYSEALSIWTDESVPDWMISPKKKQAIKTILRNHVIYAISSMLEHNEQPTDDLLAVLLEEYYYQNGEVEEDKRNYAAEATYLKFLRGSGRMAAGDYEKRLTEIYYRCKEQYALGYQFSSWKFIALFDDELSDEVFSEDKLFTLNPSFTYVNYVLIELLSISDSDDLRKQICQDIYKYFLELPPITNDGMIDTLLYPILQALIAHCDDEDMLIECIQNLIVHRQIPTAIHDTMVAKISKCIVHCLIDEHPEYFVGTFGYDSIEHVRTNATHIEEFTYKAGILHDVGKLICTDVINLQNRRILNEEFARIKSHPVAGSSLLMNSEALFDYAFIALCHHRFDNDLLGYPDGIKLPDDASRIFIEVVTVADSIDAMSDTLGRNYANPKSMETVIKELKAESGTRYSKRVVDFFAQSDELINQVKHLLYEERVEVNYDIYRKYVLPDIHFRPEDEKYVSKIEDEHLDSITESLAIEYEVLSKVYENCRDYSYMMKDGYDRIFGVVLGEQKDENMFVRTIFVTPDHRREGIGSALLSQYESSIKAAGIKKVYIPEIVEGHYDVFCWRNGYSKSATYSDWLRKEI